MHISLFNKTKNTIDNQKFHFSDKICDTKKSLTCKFACLRGFSTRDGPKNRFFFFNIYDVDNEFYEKEEGAMYGPGIAD